MVTDPNLVTDAGGPDRFRSRPANANAAYSVTNNQVTITTTDANQDVIVSTYTGYTSLQLDDRDRPVQASTNAAPTATTPTGTNVWTVPDG